MQKSFIFYGIALVFLLALGAFILLESKNQIEQTAESTKLSPRAVGDEGLGDSDNSNSNEDLVSDPNQESLTDDSSGGGSSGSSETRSEALVGNDVDSQSYCGVSNQFDITDKNLETSLNEAQNVILECMASALSSCSDGRMQLISNNGGSDWAYSITSDSSGNCLVQGTDSSFNLKNCSFSSEVISSLFSQADQEYPQVTAARFFKVIEIVQSSGGEVNLTSGNTETVTCT